MENFSTVSLVGFSFLGFFFASSNLSWWILLENSSFLFLNFFLKNFAQSKVWESILKFFLIQSFASIFFIFFFEKNTFVQSMNSSSQTILIGVILLLSLWVKMGIFPLHFWFFPLLKLQNFKIFFLFSFLLKIIPMLIFTKIFWGSLHLIFLSALIGGVFFFVASGSLFAENIFIFLFTSSNFHMMLVMLLFLGGTSVGLSGWNYFFLYGMNMGSFFFFFWKKKFSSTKKIFLNKKNFPMIFLSLFMLSGFPPSIFFFLKLNFFSASTLGSGGLFFFFLILLTSFFYLMGLFNFFVKFDTLHLKISDFFFSNICSSSLEGSMGKNNFFHLMIQSSVWGLSIFVFFYCTMN